MALQVIASIEGEGIPLNGKKELTWFLNMEIIRNRKERTLTVSLETLINNGEGRFEVGEKRTRTPFNESMKSVLRVKTVDSKEPPIKFPYRELVGFLLYISRVRPEIAWTVGKLSRVLDPSRTTQGHVEAAKQALRYLIQTKKRKVTLGGDAIEVVAFCDSDFAGDPDNRKSTQGTVFYIGNRGSFYAKSQLQKTVAMSSCEAEYLAIADACKTIIWLRRLLRDIGLEQQSATPVYCDNESAVTLTMNQGFHERTKHIATKWHLSRAMRANGTTEFLRVDTEINIADLLTKPMKTIKRHEWLTDRIMFERGTLPS